MGVQEIADDGNDDADIEHGHNAIEDADGDRGDADNLLDNLQTQEEVAAALYCQHVQVDSVKWIGAASEAD